MLERVVLIDDSESDLLFGRIVLERSGAVREVQAFESAREALSWLVSPLSPRVDAILLDINMPAMNGFEFLEAYQASPVWQLPQTRRAAPAVVMLSSSADPEDRRRALEFACVRGFLTKPLSSEDVRRLEDLLGS